MSGGGRIGVRAAQAADAEAIAHVHVRTWQTAYRGQVPDEYLDSLSVPFRTERWRSILADLEPPAAVLVALDDDAVVGFAHAMESRDPDAASGTGEVTSIYLLADHWDAGIGRALFAETVEHLDRVGFDAATLWVLETNERARRFYEAAGWSPDGATQVYEAGGARIPELRYRIDLASRRPPPAAS